MELDAISDFMRLRGQAADCEMVASIAAEAQRTSGNSHTAATGWHREHAARSWHPLATF
jgi:hypothetical protein